VWENRIVARCQEIEETVAIVALLMAPLALVAPCMPIPSGALL
jgi:hypothetical protein